jgi:hypothetical protein
MSDSLLVATYAHRLGELAQYWFVLAIRRSPVTPRGSAQFQEFSEDMRSLDRDFVSPHDSINPHLHWRLGGLDFVCESCVLYVDEC